MNIYDSSIFPKGILRIVVQFIKLYHTVKYYIKNGYSNKGIKFKDYQKTRPLGIRPVICYAPFKSMYFGVDGKVIACCLNRQDFLGVYSKQTIKQIWQGAPIENLRDLLSKNEFPQGCSHCKQRIESGNFDAVEASTFDVIHSKNSYPVIMEFELSNICNLECIMCLEINSSKKAQRSGRVIKQELYYNDNFVEELNEFIPHLKRAKFLGGEPFLMPIYYKIWDKIIRLNPDCLIIVQTNATILNEKIKKLLDQGNFRIGVSIDSFHKDNYEIIRVNSNFEVVMQNIEFFRLHSVKNKYPFSIAICPIQQNWKEIPNMVNYCNQHDTLVFFNTVINPPECSLYNLSLNKLKDVLQFMISSQLPQKTITEKKNYIHFNDFINHIDAWVKKKEALINSWNYEKQILDKKTMRELIEEIDKILLDYYSPGSELNNDYITIKKFSDNYQKATSHFMDDYCFKRSVYRLSRQPIEIFIDELKHLSKKNMPEIIENIILKGKEEEQTVMADME